MEVINLTIACLFFMVIGETYGKSVICTYAGWAQFRESEGKFFPEDIDVNLCTYVSFSSLEIDLKTHLLVQKNENDHEIIARIVKMKKFNPKLKVIISIGGWKHDEEEPRFSKMAKNKLTRGKFISSAIAYMKQHQLDGLSLDWEYPASRNTSTENDKKKFTSLLMEIRQAFSAEKLKYSLSAAVSGARQIIKNAYEVREIQKHVDWVNLMSYNLHGKWEKKVGHHTAVKESSPSVTDSLNAWLEQGMPTAKINLGIATYGRTYTLKDKKTYDIGAPVKGAGKKGKYTDTPGLLAYYEICEQKWDKRISTNKSKVGKPYSVKGDQWVGYESPYSITQEVVGLVNKECLHGIHVWSLDLDDFHGRFCDQGKYPLLVAAVDALNLEHCADQ